MTERLVFEIIAVLLLFGTTTALAFTLATVSRLTAAVTRLVDQIDDVEVYGFDDDPEPTRNSLPESITRLVARNGKAA